MILIKKFSAVTLATMIAATLVGLYLYGQMVLANYLTPMFGEWIFAPVLIIGISIQMGLQATVGSALMDKFLNFYKGIGREVQTPKA